MHTAEQCPIESSRSRIEREHNEGCDQHETLEQIFRGHLKFGDSIRTIARTYQLPDKELQQWLITRKIIRSNTRKVISRSNLSSQAIYARKKLGIPLHLEPLTRSQIGTLAALSRHNPRAAREMRAKFHRGQL